MNIKEFVLNINSKSPGNVFLFFGEEDFLIRRYLEMAKNILVPPRYAEFNCFAFEGRMLDYPKIEAAVESLPQFSEHKILFIKNTDIFQGKKGENLIFLEKLFYDIPTYVHVFMVEKTIDKKKKNFLSLIEDKGGVVEFAAQKTSELQRWLKEKFDNCDKIISPQDILHIILSCGKSMYNLDQEFQKITAYVGTRNEITLDDIDKMITITPEFKVFDILDNIVHGNRREVLSNIKVFKDNKEQPSVILAIMGSLIAELLMIKQLESADLGVEVEKYFEPNRKFLIPKLSKQSRTFKYDFLRASLEKCLWYDVCIKTGKMEAWTAIEVFAASLMTG